MDWCGISQGGISMDPSWDFPNLKKSMGISHGDVQWKTQKGRVPSGKRSHNHGQSPFLLGKLPRTGHFQ